MRHMRFAPFGTHELANSIGRHGTLISRLRLDVNLFELPPVTNKRGRPRIIGAPLPKLESYLNAADECWTKVTLSHWYGAKEKTHTRLFPAPVCGIEPALHQRYSDGCWCAILLGKWNHRRSSAPTPIWIQPKSSRTSQSDGKWRSLFRRCALTSELRLNVNGPKKRSREPHQHCSVITVWFVSGRTRLWSLIGCHTLQPGIKRPTLHSPMQLL